MEGIPRVYEDIEIHEEWTPEEAHDTLIVPLPGFRKENLRIQVTSSRNIRVHGERPVGVGNKWLRFKKEFPIPSDCDGNEVSANFERGILYVKLPKAITPAAVDARDKRPKTPTEAPKAPKASVESKKKEKPLKPPTTSQAPEAPKEALKTPTTEAHNKPPKEHRKPPTPTQAHNKPPKEAPKAPIMEATTPQKSTFDPPQPQKTTNASNYQEEPKRSSNGSSSQTNDTSKNHVSQWKTDREKLLDAEQDRVNKNTTSHHAETESHKKHEDYDRAKKAVADAITKEEYKGAIFGRETSNGFGGDACSYRPQQGYNYKQVIGGLVMELKEQPRKLVNLGLAVLFILVIGLYIKKAITSIHEFKREEL